jgi:hypothetical protein
MIRDLPGLDGTRSLMGFFLLIHRMLKIFSTHVLFYLHHAKCGHGQCYQKRKEIKNCKKEWKEKLMRQQLVTDSFKTSMVWEYGARGDPGS